MSGEIVWETVACLLKRIAEEVTHRVVEDLWDTKDRDEGGDAAGCTVKKCQSHNVTSLV